MKALAYKNEIEEKRFVLDVSLLSRTVDFYLKARNGDLVRAERDPVAGSSRLKTDA